MTVQWDTKEKNRIRAAICKKKSKNAYDSVLLLPGSSCLDLKLLVQRRAIDPRKTNVVMIERDPKVVKQIKDTAISLGILWHFVYDSELHEIDLEKHKFDFVYLDTCGQLNANVVNWLCKQVQLGVFEEGCKISVAFSQWFRVGTEMYSDYMAFLKNEGKHLVKLEPMIGNNISSEYQLNSHRAMGTLLKDLFGDVEKSWVYKNDAKSIPMHVFSFKGRSNNKGTGSVIKFLSQYTTQTPDVITPALRATVKRYKLVKPLKAKTPKVKAKLESKDLAAALKLVARLEKMVYALEKKVTQQTTAIRSLRGKINTKMLSKGVSKDMEPIRKYTPWEEVVKQRQLPPPELTEDDKYLEL